jgi:hypothetical protein
VAGSLKPEDRESDRPGSTCRGKALWVGKAVLIDEGAVEAILVPHEASGPKPGVFEGRDRERQRFDRQLCAWPTTPSQSGIAAQAISGIHTEPKGEEEP